MSETGEGVVVLFKRSEKCARLLLPLPKYQTANSAGLDLQADVEVTLAPMERKLIPTGFHIELPVGYEAQIRPRSGIAVTHGVTVVNSPGTVDADYRGEVCVGLINLGVAPYRVERGSRIAQMVIAPVARAVPSEAQELSATERGAGGFGHTGIK